MAQQRKGNDMQRDQLAELRILEAYDELRRSAGHDYGAGQRAKEISSRRRELGDVDYEPTEVELALAFDRVGQPRLNRVRGEGYRSTTPATVRTRLTWRRVERLYARDVVEADELARRQFPAGINGRTKRDLFPGLSQRLVDASVAGVSSRHAH